MPERTHAAAKYGLDENGNPKLPKLTLNQLCRKWFGAAK